VAITVFAGTMAEAMQESAIIAPAAGLGGYPDSAPYRDRGS
jgi:hypothetical protein